MCPELYLVIQCKLLCPVICCEINLNLNLNTEGKKNSVKWSARDSNLGPLVYEASVLLTELSFQMKNWEQIIAI